MFQKRVLLSKYSNFKIGGPAKYFFEAKNVEEIIKAVKLAKRLKTPFFILGGGTNILFSDKGFNGLVLKPNIKFIKRNGNFLRVGVGVQISQLLNYSINNNLTGLEWSAGIPGTIGGAVRGNAGAFGGEMKDIITEVSSLDISEARFKIIKRKKSDCCFGYRSSIFSAEGGSVSGGKNSKTKEIITEVVLRLKKGEKSKIKEIINRNISYRRKNHPLGYPSAGSVFKNVDIVDFHEYEREYRKYLNKRFVKISGKFAPINDGKIPAAYLIAEADLKGISRGGAMISSKHPNFIVNISNATAKDVKNLIKLAKKEVKNKFKVDLEEEIVFV
ncbi:MAG: UDP-N-acetylmuramate dehydrogenase [Patescibacteria group bacterium]